MNALQFSIFTNEQTEYSIGLLGNPPTIDFTDWPVPPSICQGCPGSQLGGSGYLVTASVIALGYYEVQFNLAATFLGCNMQHGDSACGVNIRQGIAHMIDKTIFANSDPAIPFGTGIPLDNPVPTNAVGGLLSPDSCLYDNRNIAGWTNQTNTAGSLCSVGAGTSGSDIGGASYHVATATGADGFTWLQAPGSKDLDEAAAHFVLAGVANGCDGGTGASSCLTSTDSKLSGVIAPICSTPSCSFFVVNDNPARLDLGNGLWATICYILTGTYGTPGCTYLATTSGPATAFPGFITSTTTQALTWGAYTAAYQGPTFYDGSLYSTYNSAFVSGVGTNQVSGGGPCSNAAVPTVSASNYMYLCNANYDALSSQMETSPCLLSIGDPVAGATSNNPAPGTCTPSGPLSSHSAGVLAEAAFGQGVYTLPVLQTKDQFGYLQCSDPASACTTGQNGNSWFRADNNAGVGLPNYFTWLNAWNPNPAIAGTIRQGFRQTTLSVSPYTARIPQATYIKGGIYDSLYVEDPLDQSQFFNWMTENTQTLTSVSYGGGVTGAPPSTAVTYRFTLRPDLTFQDGRPVTSYDVAFSYLSQVGNGAVLGAGASTMTGITILSPTVFDIGVTSTGPFILPNLTNLPIVPGRYWSNAGPSLWDSAISVCSTSACPDVQYTLAGSTVNCNGACTNFPATLVTINPADLSASFDPVQHHILIGSGPWQCATGANLGYACSTPIGTGNSATSYALTAFPNYFRSSQRLAIYLWSGESDLNAIGPATAVGSCFNAAVNLAGPCGHYQQGAGNPGAGTPVSVTTVGNVDIFFNLNWLAPFEWTTSPPAGIAPPPPLLYGPGATFQPNPGGSSCATPNTYYDC